MANIPIREKHPVPQSRPPQRPASPYGRPVQYGQQSMPPRVQQMQRVNPHVGNVRQSGYPMRPMPPRAAAEQLRPVKTPKRNTAPAKKQKSKARRKKDYSKLKDFLLAFTISFVLFGIAAIIVCNALISLFS